MSARVACLCGLLTNTKTGSLLPSVAQLLEYFVDVLGNVNFGENNADEIFNNASE